MKRKLIKQGASGGLTIYVPKDWAVQRGLSAGDEVDLAEEGDLLVVSSSVQKQKEITFEFTSEDKDYFQYWIHNAYRLGYDKIVVNSSDAAILKKVEHEIIPQLIGFEVTHHDKKSLTLEDVSEPAEEKFDIMLRRSFLTIKEMGEEIIAAGEKNKDVDISRLELRAVRVISFCRRALTKKFVIVPNPLIHWELLIYLRLFARGYLHLSLGTLHPELVSYLKSVNQLFNLLYEGYYNQNRAVLHQIQKLRKTIGYAVPEEFYFRHKQCKEVALIQYLARLMQNCSGTVFSSLLDKS